MSKIISSQGRPRSHPPSRFQARTRDRAVTAGAQSHGTAHRLRVPADRLRAYQPAVKLAKMARKRAQRRWRRAAHAICLAGACSCTLGDAPVGRRCHARQRVLQGQPPSASRFSAACWPEDIRRSDTLNTIRGGGLCVNGPRVSQQLHRVLHGCILCFAARGSFKPSRLTSLLAKVGAPDERTSCVGKIDRPVCVLAVVAAVRASARRPGPAR